MKSWEDYKNHIKENDPEGKKDIDEIEELAEIVGAMIDKRNDLGISQRELADKCGIPQSSVARIETFKTTPNLDTLIKLFDVLGLKLNVASL
jgi:ribosome-binding protein aMBF1 (putative translation factor)